jgi:hypothetical protein
MSENGYISEQERSRFVRVFIEQRTGELLQQAPPGVPVNPKGTPRAMGLVAALKSVGDWLSKFFKGVK